MRRDFIANVIFKVFRKKSPDFYFVRVFECYRYRFDLFVIFSSRFPAPRIEMVRKDFKSDGDDGDQKIITFLRVRFSTPDFPKNLLARFLAYALVNYSRHIYLSETPFFVAPNSGSHDPHGFLKFTITVAL